MKMKKHLILVFATVQLLIVGCSVDKESLIQSSKGLTTTQPVPAPELRYFMKKV